MLKETKLKRLQTRFNRRELDEYQSIKRNMSLGTDVKPHRQPTRKHIAERQRRARINYLLEQLEVLITPSDNEENPVKLEKAEVLERTVEYIKRINFKSESSVDSVSTYMYGYMKCIESIDQYLKEKHVPQSLQCDIHSHLVSRVHHRNHLHVTPEVRDQPKLHAGQIVPRNSATLNDDCPNGQQFYSMDYNTDPLGAYSFNKNDLKGAMWRPW